MKVLKPVNFRAEPIIVRDLALVEELITIPLEDGNKIEFHAGTSSRSRVLVDYVSAETPKERTVERDFYLEPGSCVDVFHVLEGDIAHGSLSVKIRYHLKKHATLNVWIYVDGGDFSCFEQEVLFKEEHGFASLHGLTLVGGNAQVYHKVKAQHEAGHCISRQFFKSLVAGQSKSGFESLVSVAKGAVKSDSKQLNKNLILSPSAQAYSRPELRIHTDDVSCVHGSATGELSADELFYMRSRGISHGEARFMMMAGFAAEVIEEVSSASLKTHLEELIRNKIEKLAQDVS
jgi:Fe-S cluster assembly protein SufD